MLNNNPCNYSIPQKSIIRINKFYVDHIVYNTNIDYYSKYKAFLKTSYKFIFEHHRIYFLCI